MLNIRKWWNKHVSSQSKFTNLNESTIGSIAAWACAWAGLTSICWSYVNLVHQGRFVDRANDALVKGQSGKT